MRRAVAEANCTQGACDNEAWAVLQNGSQKAATLFIAREAKAAEDCRTPHEGKSSLTFSSGPLLRRRICQDVGSLLTQSRPVGSREVLRWPDENPVGLVDG